MSAQKTKFPTKSVPARRMHQGTTIVGKNGLPVDALATLEPGVTILIGTDNISYSAPTVTVSAGNDLSSIINYNASNSYSKSGVLLFTDSDGANFIIDPSSINNTTKTFDIYKEDEFTNPPVSIATKTGWFQSEAELVNRLQTTSSAVIDSVEFRDIDIKFSLDGDPVRIVDKEGHELDILPDGSLPFSSSPYTTPVIANPTASVANTEYSYTFPDGTRKFRINARGNSKLQISYSSGTTNTQYITIYPGNSFEESELSTTSFTIYYRSSKANEVVEILSWS